MMAKQNPRIIPVNDRASQNGDELVLDYAGFCDGVQFPGGTAEMQTLVLGSHTFIPGFEEQLLDKVCGEKVTVHVTFPEAYHAPELAGKAAEFRCVIHQIRVKTAYQLDDTFAKEVGGCDTLEEMRTKLRESLQAYADERGEMDLQDRLLRQAAATLDYTPTAEEMEYAMDQQMETLKAQLARQGLSIEMYCSFLGTDEQKLREEARAAAEAMLRSQATIDRIVILEGLEAEPDEIAEALAVICRQNDMTMEQLKPYYDAEFEKAVVRSVLSTKVTKLIRDAAIITETA
jgi:trigger factor